MRHNDARKWLHAALDLLPVLLIPVFMIYSHRHTLTQQTTVDISYKYETNEVNTISDLVLGNIYHFEIENDLLDRFITYDDEDLYLKLNFINIIEYDFGNYSFILDETLGDSQQNNGFISVLIDTRYENTFFKIYFTNNDINDYIYAIETTSLDSDAFTLKGDFIFEGYYGILPNTELHNYITSSEFNVIESVDVHDETSSVMNVFMDNFNGAVDKYFNMGNVFNLNGVYQWFNTNIFGGNAPTIIYSVWNIALYELVMDLLFLLYGLFMWFIDMCKHLMEKPFKSIK